MCRGKRASWLGLFGAFCIRVSDRPKQFVWYIWIYIESLVTSANYNEFRVIRSDLFTKSSTIAIIFVITFLAITYRVTALRGPSARVGISDNLVKIEFSILCEKTRNFATL